MRFVRASCVVAGAASLMLLHSAKADTSDGLPPMWSSIASRPGTVEGPNTPKWNVIKHALKLVSQDQGVAFAELLSDRTDASLVDGSKKLRLTAELITKVSQSCIGPYLFDEGRAWVQFSYVCRIKSATPLSQIFTFHQSPELAVTVWYKGSHLERLLGQEPGWIPGAKRISMGAADQVVEE